MTSEEKIDIIEAFVNHMLKKSKNEKHPTYYIAGILEGMLMKFAKTDDDIKEIERLTK